MADRANQCPVFWLQVTLLIVCLVSCTPSTIPETPTVTMLPIATELASKPNQVRQRILLPQGAGAVAFGNGSIWVVNRTEHHVLRVDMETGKAVGTPIALDFEPGRIAYGEGGAWVVSADHTRVARIDPQTNEVIAEIDLRPLEIPDHVLLLITAGEGAVWIADQTHVIQIDPRTNQIVGEPLPIGEEIISVALGHGTLWTGSHDDGIISRVDAETHKVVASFNVGFSVHGLAVSDESAWVLDEHGFAVVRIDPQTNQLGQRIPIDFIGANLTAGAGSVWVAPAARDNGAPTGNDGIARISEDEKEILETIHVGDVYASEYYSVYFSEGSSWVLVNTPQASIIEIIP
jgi:streptogramin lyase